MSERWDRAMAGRLPKHCVYGHALIPTSARGWLKCRHNHWVQMVSDSAADESDAPVAKVIPLFPDKESC